MNSLSEALHFLSFYEEAVMFLDTSTMFRRADVYVSSLALVVVAYLVAAFVPGAVVRGGTAEGSIQGYVAITLSSLELVARGPAKGTVGALVSTDLSSPIFLPDIEVWAKNLKTGVTSSHVVTNPQGYFVVPNLPRGTYQICVSGKGYNTQCDDHTINVTHPADILDHVVAIQPSASAIAGTVWLADRTTPCFWFRPAMDTHALVAKVSLLDANQRVVAGPVNGNTSGQYVLPTATGTGRGNLHAVCDTAITDAVITMPAGIAVQDVSINNHAPQILTLDLTKGGVGVRRANPGDVIRATVLASDLDGDPLHYRWVDDSGRSLGLPDAPSVDWPLLNASTLNTLHVQVSDSRGGIATFSRTLESGPDAIFFAGRVFDRQSLAAIANATVSLNKVATQTDAGGNFHISVPDAGQFVLNVTKPGFALASSVYRNRATNIAVPLDAAQTTAVNGASGGTIQFPPAGCQCRCRKPDRDEHHYRRKKHDADDEDKDKDKDDDDKDAADRFNCGKGQGGGNLSVGFPAGALVTSTGAKFNGVASVEGFQYDLTKPNPIPGDFGGVYQGKPVRLATFGAFHIQPRDAQGHALKMAAGKQASVSLPIQTSQLATAPAVIPLFHYDEDTGSWIEDGTLTRTGNRYVGHIGHFSAFNADTIFPGGACVKVVLDGSFHLPVTLDASYFDPTAGTFNHNGSQSSDPIIGVERMRPNQNFTLTITDSVGAVVSVALNSGKGLDQVQFPAGVDSDQTNFTHCNGPIQVFNQTIPPNRPYFLGKVFGGNIVDNSAAYQTVTDAQPGGSRDTLVHWKTANGFLPTPTGEATAIYFNNGDLKFGRDMHCRVTNTGTNALACYVSNFGVVGTDDAPAALAQAVAYEASNQTTPQPAATVAMEYDPVKGVQFWTYHGEVVTGGVSDGGKYFPNPALDSQQNKSMPDICMGCHFGTYNGSTTTGVAGAAFLPFDLDSFKDQTDQLFPAHPPSAAVQTQLHLLNNMIANTGPPAAVTQLVNQLWYSSLTPTVPFTFNQGAAQLTGTPFVDSQGIHHEPLYDNVVKDVCRTCHVATPLPWNAFTGTGSTSGMNNVSAGTFQAFACGSASKMPNAEVPWLRYWQESKSSTLASELSLNGCPNQ
jgi:hypothetical protein